MIGISHVFRSKTLNAGMSSAGVCFFVLTRDPESDPLAWCASRGVIAAEMLFLSETSYCWQMSEAKAT
jgi:hypothetical protein